jgi:hypothetical protein
VGIETGQIDDGQAVHGTVAGTVENQLDSRLNARTGRLDRTQFPDREVPDPHAARDHEVPDTDPLGRRMEEHDLQRMAVVPDFRIIDAVEPRVPAKCLAPGVVPAGGFHAHGCPAVMKRAAARSPVRTMR